MGMKLIKLSTGTIVKIIAKFTPNEDGFLYEIMYKSGRISYLEQGDKFKLL